MARSNAEPSFFDVRRREIDSYLFVGNLSAAVLDGGAHPFFRFLDGGVRQPYHVVRRKAVACVHFDVHGNALQPDQRESPYLREHFTT